MRITALSVYMGGEYPFIKVEAEEEGGLKACACYTADRLQSGDFQALHTIFTQYDTRALKVRRTRERVILRFLRYFKERRSLESVPNIASGHYYRLVRLSEQLQIFNSSYTDNRFYGTFATNEAFRDEIAVLVGRTRAYGPRPTRRLTPLPAKPVAFKRLWQGSYHSKDMGSLNAKCASFSAAQGNFMMGVELEVNYRGEVVGDDNYLYMSEDGSLGDYGAEFVTRPDSAKVHVEELGAFLKANNLTADHRCGMHVHVSRRMLTSAAIHKIRGRVYDPGRREWTCKVIARRPENNYWTLRRDSYEMSGKYTAVNCRGSRTIEFRLFSGTTNIHLIKRRLQWVNAICKWAMGCGRVRGTAMTAYHSQRERERAIDRIEARYSQTAGGNVYVCTDEAWFISQEEAIGHQANLDRGEAGLSPLPF